MHNCLSLYLYSSINLSTYLSIYMHLYMHTHIRNIYIRILVISIYRTWPLRLITARRYFSLFLTRGLRSIFLRSLRCKQKAEWRQEGDMFVINMTTIRFFTEPLSPIPSGEPGQFNWRSVLGF